MTVLRQQYSSSTQYPGQWGRDALWEFGFSPKPQQWGCTLSPCMGCSMILAGSSCLVLPCFFFSYFLFFVLPGDSKSSDILSVYSLSVYINQNQLLCSKYFWLIQEKNEADVQREAGRNDRMTVYGCKETESRKERHILHMRTRACTYPHRVFLYPSWDQSLIPALGFHETLLYLGGGVE